ncbi:MAG: YcjF family protein [Phycisphaerales bacterium]|jgi:uncharacterized protein (DUF697 family)/tellurite resistance protein|nr:tellurite resistance TerB family protein [Phycisphaeraceae bacterium]
MSNGANATTDGLTPDHAAALTAIAVLAAFADGAKSDSERAAVKDVVEGLATQAGQPSTAAAVRRVLMKQTSVQAEAQKLDTPELRALAWETALAVCEADGATCAAEKGLLDELARALGRDAVQSRREVGELDAITLDAASEPTPALSTAIEREPVAPMVAAGAAAGAALAAADAAKQEQALARTREADAMILRSAILTAAIELLPQGLASVAIIPLQTKLVHSIAKLNGYPMTAAMIKEFLAVIGVGVAGQVVEDYARKFLGKLAKQFLGGMAGSVAKTAVNWGTGPIMTFATTYAMGQVAQQYYSGGRTLSAVNLKALFATQVERAKTLYAQYEPQIRSTASSTSPTQILSMLRPGA